MVRSSFVMACCALFALLLTVPASTYPSPSNYFREDVQYEPEELVDMLNRLSNMLQIEHKMDTEKRALDLGLSRGYSGALQAKHLMGLAAANYAGGPGRRRRDVNAN